MDNLQKAGDNGMSENRTEPIVKDLGIPEIHVQNANAHLHIRSRESWPFFAAITGNSEALLSLSETLRLAALNDKEMSCGAFHSADGETYPVVVEPVTEDEFKKRSQHYCDRHDPANNLLPEDFTRALLLGENEESGEISVLAYGGIEKGRSSWVRKMQILTAGSAEAVLLNVLFRDLSRENEERDIEFEEQYGTGAFATLVHLVEGLIETFYPESVFNGSIRNPFQSGDPGPVFIREIRLAMKKLEESNNG
ncbi:MAG: hypothetical protein ACYCT9_12230 [Leptospirillum sp.]